MSIRIPLLKDHHTHPLLYAAFSSGPSLVNVESKSNAIDLIQSAYSNSEMVVAHGWRSNQFGWTPEELQTLPPVAIFNVSLHALQLNRAGKEIVRRRYGNEVDKISDQDWYEANFRKVLNWFANLNASEQALVAFYDDLLDKGVYYAEEMLLIDEREIELFRESNLLPRTRFWAAPDTYEQLSVEARQSVYGLKLFTDGALGARTAALNRPYLSQTGAAANRGVLLYSDESLAKTISSCLATGKSLAIHSIGDRALEQLVKILESMKSAIEKCPELRIEHAQLISLDVARRAKQLGLVLSMQPNFSSDSDFYADRIDPEYCRTNNPFRMLIDQVGYQAGADLVFGSDGMPHGVEYAIQQSLYPVHEIQRLTLGEFESGYCMNDLEHGCIEVELDQKKMRCRTILRTIDPAP